MVARAPVAAVQVWAAVMVAAAGTGAATGPNRIPTRDVDISYRVRWGEDPIIRQRVRWLAAEKIERIDGPGETVTLADRGRDSVLLLTPSRRLYTSLDAPPHGPFDPEVDASPEQGAHARIAGYVCTEWHWTTSDGPHSLCVTDDGVMLRYFSGTRVRVEAVSVTYRKQAAKIFRLPRGYQSTPGAEDPTE